jgi:hypothetical protein
MTMKSSSAVDMPDRFSDNPYLCLKWYFKFHPAFRQAAAVLRDGVNSRVRFEADPATYLLIKEQGQVDLRPGDPISPHFTFFFSKPAVAAISAPGDESIASYAERLFLAIFEENSARRISFQCHIPIRTLVSYGYLEPFRLTSPGTIAMLIRRLSHCLLHYRHYQTILSEMGFSGLKAVAHALKLLSGLVFSKNADLASPFKDVPLSF